MPMKIVPINEAMKNSINGSAKATAVFNSRGSGELIELLRRHGADPYRENFHGVSPLGLARDIGNYDVAQFFQDLPK